MRFVGAHATQFDSRIGGLPALVLKLAHAQIMIVEPELQECQCDP